MARREQQELSQEALARITRSIRSLADDRVERGFDLSRSMHCDSCDQDKSSAGATTYGAYKLCNDCLLDFTLALASGQVENVVDFMTRRTDDDGSRLPPDLAEQRDRSTLAYNSVHTRDKLLPSNEPC